MDKNSDAAGAGRAELTHFDRAGRARMVDVSKKEDTFREAVARCEVIMRPETLRLIEAGGLAKGDVLDVARLAGIMGAKGTGHLIPLAHPIMLTGIEVYFQLLPPYAVEVEARVHTVGKTGVEMEALTAAAVAALTIYDMCKAVDRGMLVQNLRLISKTGGKSGEFRRENG
ncbi:MAG TPA: cyclic pyranopterin monophosphate synthase MoaC [Desulfotomaculum sp.]|jgi:cyclic pyranopterin phosphate synthase|nr:cyclic pyranopterin monophosphate synthase MoaC [Desulfotomaculum sp.]